MLEQQLANIETLTLSEIASVIRKTWPKVNFAAAPYLEAMACLETMADSYGLDSAKTIIVYFLSNATAYRGDAAKVVRKELKKRAGIK